MDWQLVTEKTILTRLISTGIAVVLIFALRQLVIHRLVKREDISPTRRRQWLVTSRNLAVFLAMGIVVILWLEQLRTIAATIVVIAAAIVIATKELLLNIVGFIYQYLFKYISVGDRIEIEDIRGDVMDSNFMGMTLMEIGPGAKTHQYTGLTVFVPNSKFLLTPVKNETHLWGKYVFHLISIPIKVDTNWKEAEQALLNAADTVCAPYLENAKKSMHSLALKHSLEEPTVAPRVSVQIDEPEKINLILRVPVPTRRRGKLEQDITRKYLELMAPEEQKTTSGNAHSVDDSI